MKTKLFFGSAILSGCISFVATRTYLKHEQAQFNHKMDVCNRWFDGTL